MQGQIKFANEKMTFMAIGTMSLREVIVFSSFICAEYETIVDQVSSLRSLSPSTTRELSNRLCSGIVVNCVANDWGMALNENGWDKWDRIITNDIILKIISISWSMRLFLCICRWSSDHASGEYSSTRMKYFKVVNFYRLRSMTFP